MESPAARTSPQLALVESQNILQDEQVGGEQQSSTKGGTESASSTSALSSCAPAPAPTVSEASVPRIEAAPPASTAGIEEKLQSTGRPEEGKETVKAEAGDAAESVSTPTQRLTNQPGESEPEDADAAASLALARQLLEEEAMASYAAAVDMFRGGGDGGSNGDGGGGSFAAIEGVSSEDMAAMRALMEEDEMASSAVAMAEEDSLDYDGMLELGSAIGDVRQERWRLRCHAVINSLPLVKYIPGGIAGEDSKCLVCQCDYEEGEELRKLPCKHTFHAECVDGWLEQSEECPTCRHSVSEG